MWRMLVLAEVLVLGLALSVPVRAADWPTASLTDVDIAADLGERIDVARAGGKLHDVHGIVLIRRGRLVLERYYSGYDYRFSQPLGVVDFAPDTLHDIRSITKSVVTLLYGIALAHGLVPLPEAPLYDQFPEYADLATPDRRAITVEHALNMTMGLAWDERPAFGRMSNDATAMRRSADHVRYVLQRPVVAAPGTQWDYSGGATTLVGALIAKGSGQALPDFAREHLFTPLAIDASEWISLANGELVVSGGLRLRPRDLAKIGQLVLNSGSWEGRQIVPADWIARSTEAHVRTRYWIRLGDRYGYQWWLGHTWANGEPYVAGNGYGGQFLAIMPTHDLVLVVTAGGYGEITAGRSASVLLEDLVLPALARP